MTHFEALKETLKWFAQTIGMLFLIGAVVNAIMIPIMTHYDKMPKEYATWTTSELIIRDAVGSGAWVCIGLTILWYVIYGVGWVGHFIYRGIRKGHAPRSPGRTRKTLTIRIKS